MVMNLPVPSNVEISWLDEEILASQERYYSNNKLTSERHPRKQTYFETLRDEMLEWSRCRWENNNKVEFILIKKDQNKVEVKTLN